MKKEGMTIGVISDTHGLLRPEVLDFLKSSDLILHAGDIGKPEVLTRLRQIAPVIAVRGNCDREAWAENLHLTEVIESEEVFLYMLHDLNKLDINPQKAGFAVIISGHTHQPSRKWEDGILYINPGSAGPRRFNLPISALILQIKGRDINVQFQEFSESKS